jgi:hypothetical protein
MKNNSIVENVSESFNRRRKILHDVDMAGRMLGECCHLKVGPKNHFGKKIWEEPSHRMEHREKY